MPHTPLHRTNIPLFQRRERIPETNYFKNTPLTNYDPAIGGPRQYNFLNTPVGEGLLGAASDIAEGASYLGEGIGTGVNIGRKFFKQNVVNPFAELFVDPNLARTPDTLGGMIDANERAANRLDTTFDKPQPGGALGPEFAEFSNIRKMTNSDLTKSVIDGTSNLITNLDEKYPSPDGSPYTNILDAQSDFVLSLTENKEIKNQLNNSSQDEVTQTINEVPLFNQTVTNASANLSNAVNATDKTEEGWQSGITNGINNFINRLSDPGFQVALSMHMEAKGGGDITDVLFAGMKASNKAKNAMFQSQKNELELLKLGVQIGNLQKPKEASKADIGAISSILKAKGGQFELSDGDAALAAPIIAGRVEVLQAMGMDQGTAIQQAIQEAVQSGQLKGQDTASGFSKFTSFLPGIQSRGSFDLNAPGAYNPGSTNIPQITTQDEYDALPSGSVYSDINGLIYTKP